jgi:hypothetical protein
MTGKKEERRINMRERRGMKGEPAIGGERRECEW